MAAHSKIGASSMHRWAACPGSVKLSEGIESRSSAYAEEGTRAHALAESWLNIGDLALDGADAEMVEHVGVYVKAVRERAIQLGAVLVVEQRFNLTQIHDDLFGTSDAVVWQPHIRRLSVIDLKYGAGIAVEAEDNEQLKYYALGALFANPQWKPVEVEIAIVQPRCPHVDGPVRAQVLSVVDLIDFADDLAHAVERVEEAAAHHERINAADKLEAAEWQQMHLKLGDHCRFCPASALCPKQRTNAQEVAKRAFAPGVQYDAALLADTLDWLPILEAWVKNVREFAYAEAEKGHTPPHYKLVEKRATAKWREGVASQLAQKLGVQPIELLEPPQLKGVTEIRKLAPGKNDKERAAFIEEFVTKESSGHTLVHESDKRVAVQLDAKSAFSNI